VLAHSCIVARFSAYRNDRGGYNASSTNASYGNPTPASHPYPHPERIQRLTLRHGAASDVFALFLRPRARPTTPVGVGASLTPLLFRGRPVHAGFLGFAQLWQTRRRAQLYARDLGRFVRKMLALPEPEGFLPVTVCLIVTAQSVCKRTVDRRSEPSILLVRADARLMDEARASTTSCRLVRTPPDHLLERTVSHSLYYGPEFVLQSGRSLLRRLYAR